MGQEIKHVRFTRQDFALFQERLRTETELLAAWFEENRFDAGPAVGGFELEAWLIDRHCRPLPINERFIQALGSPMVVPELARFNVEMNSPPHVLQGDVLRRTEAELDATWRRCEAVAGELDARLVMIGILPTVREEELNLANMSRMKRFRALNAQVLGFRHGHPLEVDIHGADDLHTLHGDVMLEAAATSFQIHLQVPPAEAARFYNAALALSAPMVAATANSPHLFGKRLWDETRIPLFEQATALDETETDAAHSLNRTTFGSGYVQSLLDCFRENLEHHPVLLPILAAQAPEALAHLRLHNGTIWRWNRPIVGFDAAGRPHLRIEHRVVPAGPGVTDAVANMALFFGLVHALARQAPAPEEHLPFEQARANFYAAAEQGLAAELVWLDGRRRSVRRLLLDELLPLARAGLESLKLAPADIDRYLSIVAARVERGRTGATWQRAWVAQHGADMQALTAAYVARQRSGAPVHEWEL